jgi:VIT1/CCC1 family predicted Fe2+/Mn2+ transporter
VPLDIACRISKALSSDLKSALETHAREHLGLNPGDLGSPLGAAAASFVSFAAGALVPLLPFLFGAGASRALAIAVALAAVALAVVGGASARLTGQRLWRGALRLLLVGGGAGIVAYGIGRLLGVSV